MNNKRQAFRQLLLVRHAKSSWKDDSLHDIDRPLNRRGLRDAPEMGRRLYKRDICPQLIISSPAVRAHVTAEAIAAETDYTPGDIVIADELYGASADDVMAIVRRLDAGVQSAMLVFHNPTITDLANRYSADPIDNVPTCGVLTLRVDTDDWADVDEQIKVVDFDYPKRVDQ